MRRLVALLRGLPVLALLGVVLVVPVHEARGGFTWLGDWNVQPPGSTSQITHTSYLTSDFWLMDRLDGGMSGSYMGGYGLWLTEVSYSRSFELSGPDGGWVLNWLITENLSYGARLGCYTIHEWSVRVDGVTLVKAQREQLRGLSNGVHDYQIQMKVGVFIGAVPHAEAFVTDQVTFYGRFEEAPEPRSVVLMALGIVGAARIVARSRCRTPPPPVSLTARKHRVVLSRSFGDLLIGCPARATVGVRGSPMKGECLGWPGWASIDPSERRPPARRGSRRSNLRMRPVRDAREVNMRRLVALLRGLPVLALLGVALVVPVHEARAGFTWLGDWQVTAVQNNSESRWSYGFTDWNPQTGSVYVGGYVYGSHYGLGGTTGQFTVTRSFELSGSDSFWVASLMLSGDAFWGGTSGYSHSANGGVRIDDLTIHTDYRGLSNGIHTFKMTLNVEVMNMRGQTWGGADAEAYITFSGHFTPAPEPSSFALLGVGLTAALWFRHRAARGGRERASSSGAA